MIGEHVRQVIDTVRRTGGSFLRYAQRTRDRALHPSRHREALASVHGVAPLRAITVICYGNVCRSPYLEAVLRRDLLARGLVSVRVDSAGFVGPDRQPPELARTVARARGLDVDAHRSRIATREILGITDLVLVMDESQRLQVKARFPELRAPVVIVADLDPFARDGRRIADPWGRAREDFESTFERLDRCSATLVAALRA